MRLDGLTGMIVDDHAHMRRVMRAILGSLGMNQVFEAEDAAEAFDNMQTKPIDFVLVDYCMPQLDGVEFIRMLRRSPDIPNNALPIVVCTAHTSLSMIKRCCEAGADEILAKPVSARQVYYKVLAAVFNRRPIVQSGSYHGPERREIKEDRYLRRAPLLSGERSSSLYKPAAIADLKTGQPAGTIRSRLKKRLEQEQQDTDSDEVWF